MPKKKILFLVGSPNQTTQMHQVSQELQDYDCFFSQLYSNSRIIKLAVKKGILDTTILGGEFKRKADVYLKENNLRNDYASSAYNNRYDMAVFCSDLIITKKLRSLKTVFVQEGMTDPLTTWGKVTRKFNLPGYWAGNTALNGTSNICDVYCAASEGYKEQFASMGTQREKIFVTGIPNYDNVESFLENDFPHHNYVLVATSDIRETFNKDDREAFIGNCVKIAAGRQLIFKLHPNEMKERAIAEIKKWAPADALIYTEGNTSHMVANCGELITQYSTVVYIGIALGKKVHSYFDVEKLKKLSPIQNGGTSAANIAGICRSYIEFKGSRNEFLRNFTLHKLQPAK
ncbi:MAG TPA: hypothetical protein VG738_22010 [Chitinophagaceae bacterium]|nr:hypothetical protein [Chitinophagaceae bacterium]